MKELTLGTKIFHIDEPNGVYELMKESPASTFWYVVYFHPSFGNVKILKDEDIGKTFFLTRGECLNARIARAKRLLELEISARERKL